MILSVGIVVAASVRALITQVTFLVDVKTVLLSRAAVKALQLHFYLYVVSILQYIIHHACALNSSI